MVKIIEDIDYQGLDDLRQRRLSARKALSKLSEELDRVLSLLESKAEKLKM